MAANTDNDANTLLVAFLATHAVHTEWGSNNPAQRAQKESMYEVIVGVDITDVDTSTYKSLARTCIGTKHKNPGAHRDAMAGIYYAWVAHIAAVLGVPLPDDIKKVSTSNPSYGKSYGGFNKWVRENKLTIASSVLEAVL